MKKYLILFATAALALIGCKKEIPTITGGDQTVTFSVVAADATKADVTAIPATIDTCVAVVRMYDAHDVLIGDIYARPKCDPSNDNTFYTFSVDLMGGQKYEVTVLLYTKGVYDVDAKLEQIKRKTAELRYNLHPEHDMFSASITYQAGGNTPLIIAKRPFAQLNLITTDLVQNFEPAVTVKYKAPSTFNAVTGVASGEQVYETFGVYDNAYAPDQCTISSDYIFASDEKSLISVEMKAEKVGTFVRTFDNLPLQRNYKTNVIGKLLSVNAPFTVQVNADWSTPDNQVNWVSVSTPAAVAAAIEAGATNISIESVPAPVGETPAAIEIPKTSAEIGIKLPENNTNPVKIVYKETTTGGQTPTLNVEAQNNTAAVEIVAPESHVVLNGEAVTTGQYNYVHVIATTSATSLVIPDGVKVNKLTIISGGIEIHGYVETVEIAESAHDILFRDCENLTDAVYAVAKQYVAEGYAADDATNSIIKAFYQDEKDKNLWHVANVLGWSQFAAAVNGGTTFEGKTVVLDSDIDFQNATVAPVGNNTDNKPFKGTFNGNNKKLSNLTVQNIVGKQGVGVFGKVYEPCVIKDLTVENATVIGDKTVAGDKAIAYVGGIAGHGYAKIQNCTFKGNIYAGYQMGGIAGSGGFTITGCTFEGNIISERDWGLGGIIGNCQDGGAISGNTAKGTISAKNSDYCGLIAGGIIGCAIYTTYDVKNNYAAMSMSYDGVAFENVYPIVGVYNIDAPGTGNEDFAALLTTLANNTWDKTISAKDSYVIMYNNETPAETGYVLNYGAATTKDSVAKIGETGYDSLPAAFAAVNAGETIEILKAGEYKVPGIPQNITIKGDVDGVVFNCVGAGSIASIPNGCTFENVSFKMGSSNYHGFQHAGTINMNGCTIEGLFFSYGDMNFDGCTFNQTASEYCMWDYGQDLTYTNCVFNCNGKFINVYNEGNGDWKLKVEGCTFNSTKKNKAALNIKASCGATVLGWDVTINNCTVNDAAMFPEASGDATSTLYVGSPVWQVDDRTAAALEANKVKVTVDGAVVYGGTVAE